MRKLFIAGNWKMNKTITEALDLAKELKENVGEVSALTIAICPSFLCLDALTNVVRKTSIKLGAQNMYHKDEGAFTGEVSALMLRDAGCDYVILGHSERRQYFSETNDLINKKTKAALKHGLVPIVCVGETLQEREAGKTFDVVKDHVTKSLKDLTHEELKKIVIAYEPVWAIGTGKTATPEQAQEVHGYIRSLLSEMANADVAQSIVIQYGGSVKPDNTKDLMKQKDIDGALVGGASLTADSFTAIITNALEVIRAGKGT